MHETTLSSSRRRWLNRLGYWLMLVCAVLTFLATLFPQRWQLGPLAVGLRSVRNPVFGLIVGYVAWRLTYDGYGRWLKRRLDGLEDVGTRFGEYLAWFISRALLVWRMWSWPRRLMLAVVLAQTFLVLRFWQSYPANLKQDRVAQENAYRTATWDVAGEHLPVLECFGQRVCDELPADARILFHGQTSALRFAYQVYPRRVFMLPQEMRQMAAGWHKQPQLRSIPSDPESAYWDQFLPDATADPAAFIREHRITHVVTFDEYDLSRCRVELAE